MSEEDGETVYWLLGLVYSMLYHAMMVDEAPLVADGSGSFCVTYAGSNVLNSFRMVINNTGFISCTTVVEWRVNPSLLLKKNKKRKKESSKAILPVE